MSSNTIIRAGWLVAGVLALFVVTAMTGIVSGGPLDPPGAPVPTMKTLHQVPGSWSRALVANDGPDTCHSSRFLCVLAGDAAVLDAETGLVWERVPSAVAQVNWAAARNNCRALALGSRKGWRLPSEEELATLLSGGLTGHPFTFLLQPSVYWTATTAPETALNARMIASADAAGNSGGSSVAKSDPTRLAWCVRGGVAADGQ